jgi:uncharacterized protein (DUF362 family)
LTRLALTYLPDGEFRRIFIKPNWVRHQKDEAFPIECLVTSPALIDALIEACLIKYPSAKRIVVGDVPLQDCDWERRAEQAGINDLRRKDRSVVHPMVRIADLRRERFRNAGGYLASESWQAGGDELGYREVVLDQESFLEEVSESSCLFRVSDYDPAEIKSSQRKGFHRYLIAGSALDCDLFINVPKMKTHQKAGITGALKNIVGINGQKAYLVHFRLGRPASGGDEFAPDAPAVVVAQTRLRELVQKRSRALFRLGSIGWRAARGICGIEVRGTPENLDKKFYAAGGSWYGNDTIWRMVYDLNKILLYAPAGGGTLMEQPQRTYLAVLDAMTAGEGNGPLQPLPVETDALVFSNDPFHLDLAMCSLMGFDWRRIPTLQRMKLFKDTSWGDFEPGEAEFLVDGLPVKGPEALPVLHEFRPAPGWRGHVEMPRRRLTCHT